MTGPFSAGTLANGSGLRQFQNPKQTQLHLALAEPMNPSHQENCINYHVFQSNCSWDQIGKLHNLPRFSISG